MARPPFDIDADDGALLANVGAGDNAQPISVSELSGALKRTIEGAFGRVRVRGEISGWKRAASGHCYLALKDADAVIDGVLWRGQASKLAFAAEDGLDVIATGKLTTYPGRSKYQIVIDSLELAGEGALMQLFEKLKARLGAEGLFDRERKQPIPALPRVIGVVTSPTGSVIRDILHRLEDRFPTHVLVWPARVQGKEAHQEVAAAVAGFNALEPDGPIPRPDLLIVARGGGSIEDLWPFNEEAVVRAVAASRIPVISAVGHETDTTLCDYAADLRAPTPTAAAELAVPVRSELRRTVAEAGMRLQSAIDRKTALASERLASMSRMLRDPKAVVEEKQQRADDWGERLSRALAQQVSLADGKVAQLGARLNPALLRQKLAADEQRLGYTVRMLDQLSPDSILKRGYARITDRDGNTLTKTPQLAEAGLVTIKLADGESLATIGEGAAPPRSSPKPKAAPKPKGSAPKNQGDLFG